jgi:ABC-type transport system substrate-binding protein
VNHTNKHLARLGVRRAIAYLMRWGVVTENRIGIYSDRTQDGTTPAVGKEWLPDYEQRAEQYIDYGETQKREQAAAELRKEGYERNDDGMWVGPDGDLLEVNVSTTRWFHGPSQTLVSWLQQFGFTSRVKEPNVFWKTWSSFDNEWDLIIGFHTRGPNHPTSSYKDDLRWGLKMTTLNEDGERVAAGNRKLEVEVPTELGATDLSGDTEVLNIPELQTRLSDPEATAEDYVEPMQKLGKFWNYWLPDIVAVGGVFNFLGDYQDFEWLDWNGDKMGDAVDNYELAYGLNAGYIRGKEQ